MMTLSVNCASAQDPGSQTTEGEEVSSSSDVITACNELHLLTGSTTIPQGNACSESMAISGVDVVISDQTTGETWNGKTDDNGQFAIEVCKSPDLQLCITEICDEACGINSLDLLRIQKIALGLEPSNAQTCYSADIDSDGEVSTTDRALLRSYLTGIPVNTDVLPSWCRWIPQSLYDDPLACDEGDKGKSCVDVDTELSSTDFVRIQVGDLDFSCTTCSYDIVSTETADRSTHSQSYDGMVRRGNEIHLASDADLLGFSMQYDISSQSHVSVTTELSGLTSTRSDGKLQIIWLANHGETLSDLLIEHQAIFSLSVGDESITLSDVEDNAVLTTDGEIKVLENISETSQSNSMVLEQRASQLVIDTDSPAPLYIYSMHGNVLFHSVVSSSTLELSDHLLRGQPYVARLGSGENAITRKLSPF